MNQRSAATLNPKIYAVVVCSLAIVLLVGSILPVPTFPGGVPATPVSPQRTIPNTDVNPYGANFFLDWEVEPWKIEKTLQMAKDAGIGWANVHFAWEALEPKKGSFWDDRQSKSTWQKYDFIVSVARKNGLKVIARLDRPPAWSRKDNTHAERPPDNYEDYGDFVEAVVSHFKGQIQHYQIWNEPNIFPEWGNQAVDPGGYVRLLKIAYERAKGADRNVYILSAPLAQNFEHGPRNLNELDFLDAMYASGAKDYFDILYANGYGFDAPPDDPADPNKLNFARITLQRQVMERNGDLHKAIWLHEFGWNASPEDMATEGLRWRRVSEQKQADYTVQAIKYARSEWPWMGVFSIWYFRQDGHITPDQSEYYFRMVDPGFTPRLIYSAVASHARPLAVVGPGQFQETNPALTVDSGFEHVLESSANGGSWLVGSKAGAGLTIKFTGTDFALVVAKEPRGPRLLVTVDGKAGNKLPPSGDGRSYFQLSSPSRQLGVVVPVAADLPYGQHTVRLVIAPESTSTNSGNAIVDGFQVDVVSQTPWPMYLVIAIVSVGLVLGFLLFVRRRSRSGRSG